MPCLGASFKVGVPKLTSGCSRTSRITSRKGFRSAESRTISAWQLPQEEAVFLELEVCGVVWVIFVCLLF